MILRGARTCDVAVSCLENEIASAMKLPHKIIISYSFIIPGFIYLIFFLSC